MSYIEGRRTKPELEARIVELETALQEARSRAVANANDHDEVISWHERRYENVIQTLNSSRGVIIELKAALKEADISGEIVIDLIKHGSSQFFLLQVEHEKLTRKYHELQEREDDF